MIEKSEVSQQIHAGPSAVEKVSLARILVATDFSKTSDRALEHALSLARTYNSRIFLAHVIPMNLMMAPELAEPFRNQMHRAAQEEMKRILASGRLFGVPHEEIIQEGTLWLNIEALIRKHGIDLVVLGTHGMSHTRKMPIGSNAEEIFRQVRIPVLTVGPAVEREPLYGIELKNILFATAFGVDAERQAAYAFSLAQEHRSRITLMHVQQHPDQEDEIVNRLHQLLPFAAELHCLPLFRVEWGDPVRAILQVAAKIHADLIVLGAKSRKGLAGHMPHTKAYHVVCGAPCPVLTIKS